MGKVYFLKCCYIYIMYGLLNKVFYCLNEINKYLYLDFRWIFIILLVCL